MPEPVKLDFSTAQPLHLDFSTAQPLNGAPASSGTADWFKPLPESHGYLYEAAAGPLRAVKNVVQGTAQAMMPRDAAEQAYANSVSVKGVPIANPMLPVGLLAQHTTDDFAKQRGDAYKAWAQSKDQGENWAGQLLSMAEKYPMIGDIVKRMETSGPGMAVVPSPQSIGGVTEAASYLKGPEVANQAASAVGKAVTNAPDAVRVLAQEQAGAGREPVMIAKAQRDATVQANDATYQERLAEETAKHAEREAQREATHQTKQAEAQAKYEAQTEAMKQGYSESYAAKNRAKLAQSRLETTKTSYEVQKDRLAQQSFDNIMQAEKAERGSLDTRWDDFRKNTEGAQADLAPVADAVTDARENILKGSKENIGIFNNVIGKVKDFIDQPDMPAGIKAAPTNLPLDQLRGFYTEINDKMFSGDWRGLPDVYQALKSVRNSLDKTISDTVGDFSGKEGLKNWQDLKSDYTDYMRTWKTTVGRDASPLAKVARLGNSASATKMGVPVYREAAGILTRATGERAPYLMARKSAFGADASTVAKLRAIDDQLGSLSAKSLKYEIPPEAGGILRRLYEIKKPNVPEAPENAPYEAAPFKGPKEPKVPAEIDPAAMRRRILAGSAARPFRWWEAVVPTYLLEHLALKSPAIREWIASQPRNELPVEKLR